jgi:hypothetical protein
METQSERLISPDTALREYSTLLQAARQRFAASRGVQAITSPDIDGRAMAAFLLHFSALSIPITEPVEGWIRRAGERCIEVGMPEVGRALQRHAKAEAGHHQYHIDDFAAMTSLWNSTWSPAVRSDDIAGIGVTRGGARYCQIHEENIQGNEPFCQLAIEYEIELLPVEFGPRFVQNCVRVLGPNILTCMTFVTSHVEFDVGHTKFNAHVLAGLIAEDQRRLPALAAAGSAALQAFSDHLTECWDLGVALAKTT